jgi:hypothetical protein
MTTPTVAPHPRPGWYLYLRTRGLLGTLLILAAAALITLLLGDRRLTLLYGSAAGLPIVFLLPLLSASAIAATVRTRWPEWDQASPRRIALRRTAVVLTLLPLSAIVLVLVFPDVHGLLGRDAAVRNLLGLTGLALLSAACVGGEHAWVLPTAYTLTVVSLGDDAAMAPQPWSWLVSPDGVHWGYALTATALGLVTTYVWGTREEAVRMLRLPTRPTTRD